MDNEDEMDKLIGKLKGIKITKKRSSDGDEILKKEILEELSKTDDKWFAYEEYSYNTGAYDEFMSVFRSFNEYSPSQVLRLVIYELVEDGGLDGKNKNKIQFFWTLISCNLQPENCLPKEEPKTPYDPNQTRVVFSDEQERERQEIIDEAEQNKEKQKQQELEKQKELELLKFVEEMKQQKQKQQSQIKLTAIHKGGKRKTKRIKKRNRKSRKSKKTN